MSREHMSTSPTRRMRIASVAKRAVVFASAVATVAGLGIAASSVPAFASMRYYSTTSSLAERSGPGTTWSVTQYVGYNAPLDVDCQVQGATNVGGNATWDHLTNGQWVTDYYTTSPSFNNYASGLGPCSRELRAMAWASAESGATGYNGYCELFVEQSYGTSGRYSSALAAFNSLQNAGQMHYDTNPPGGALVFFRNSGDGGNGHVEISRGNGTFVSTGPTVQIVNFGYGGTFTGWSYAPSSWSGR